MTSIEIDELVVQEVPERSYVVHRVQVPRDAVSATIGRLVGETHDWVFAHGGACGAPAAVCEPEPDGTMAVAVGWPCVADDAPPEPFERLVRPGGPAVVHRFVGPYDRLPDVYPALAEAMAADGLQVAGAPWEIYETNPQEVSDPQQWVTEIVWPVQA